MNHSEARLQLGADPHSPPSPELAEHLAACAECARFHREMLTLDDNIKRALETAPLESVAAPARASVTPISSAARRRRREGTWSSWALAAGVAALFIVAVWALRPSDTLAHDVVAHIGYEPNSWSSSDTVSAARVATVMGRIGASLDTSSGKVTYAHSCFVRGHLVPHLVVRTSAGPVTVIILPNETVAKRSDFHEGGLSGVITPAAHGSIVVLAQGDTNIDSVAAEIEKSVRWSDSPGAAGSAAP